MSNNVIKKIENLYNSTNHENVEEHNKFLNQAGSVLKEYNPKSAQEHIDFLIDLRNSTVDMQTYQQLIGEDPYSEINMILQPIHRMPELSNSKKQMWEIALYNSDLR